MKARKHLCGEDVEEFFHCDYCGLYFCDEDELWRHIKEEHSVEEVIDKDFEGLEALKQFLKHIYRKYGISKEDMLKLIGFINGTFQLGCVVGEAEGG